MKRPLSDRMRYLLRLITQSLADISWLLDNYPEQEAKLYVELLVELNQGYRASLSALGERLEAQGGYDFEI
jgi:hypothetical protein